MLREVLDVHPPVCMYVCMYVCSMYVCNTYVHTCYVLTNPPMPIYYVLAAVFASWFCVLIYLLQEWGYIFYYVLAAVFASCFYVLFKIRFVSKATQGGPSPSAHPSAHKSGKLSGYILGHKYYKLRPFCFPLNELNTFNKKIDFSIAPIHDF